MLVVDDDASVRTSLDSLFRSVGLAVRSFGSAPEFLAEPAPNGPACLVLDVRLPVMSGLDLQHQLAESNAALPIIVITGHGDVPMTVRAMRAGAVEVLSKPFRDQDLLDAVQHALDRSRVLRQEQASILDLEARFESLTPREREVMSLVVMGLLNKQIGYELGISEVTVKIHRGQVMQKMRAASVAELVRMADRDGKGTRALGDALEDAERQAHALTDELAALEATAKSVFRAPPAEWVAHHLQKLDDLLGLATERSALRLRRVLGSVKLTPVTPEVGRSYYRAETAVEVLALLDEASDDGSTSLRKWRRGELKASKRSPDLTRTAISLRIFQPVSASAGNKRHEMFHDGTFGESDALLMLDVDLPFFPNRTPRRTHSPH